jgi:hypothetical protein
MRVIRAHTPSTQSYFFVTLANDEGFTVQVASYTSDSSQKLKEVAKVNAVG